MTPDQVRERAFADDPERGPIEHELIRLSRGPLPAALAPPGVPPGPFDDPATAPRPLPPGARNLMAGASYRVAGGSGGARRRVLEALGHTLAVWDRAGRPLAVSWVGWAEEDCPDPAFGDRVVYGLCEISEPAVTRTEAG